MSSDVRLLPQSELVRTSDLDQGAWNYSGPLGWVSRQRITMVARLLSDSAGAAASSAASSAAGSAAGGPGRLLEIGYGSGVFAPTLVAHTGSLYGIDVHDKPAEVTQALRRNGIEADLRTGSVTDLPYDDAFFDTLVCISVLEFVDDLETACREMRRVLAPGGRLVVVTPGHSAVLDLGLKLLTGERAEDTFQGRRQRIVPTLSRHFRAERTLTMPPVLPAPVRLYTALLLR